MKQSGKLKRNQALQEFWLERVLLPLNVRHIHGLKRIAYTEDELIVICLARNAECHITSFIEHYIDLGVKHIIFLDNTSTDNTVSLASHYPQVSVYHTTLPFRHNNRSMRRYLVNRFGRKNRWLLCVDVDELFDYPYSDQINLKSFLRYLYSKSYTAVVAYLLDMFSDHPLSRLQHKKTDLKKNHPFYDVSAVRKLNYFDDDSYQGNRFILHNILTNSEIKRYVGGIRSQLFDLPNVYLIKHPLIFLDGRVKLVHQHFADYAFVADITGVLYHYKFIDGFPSKVEEAVRDKQYASDSYEYQYYQRALESTPQLCLKYQTAKKLDSVNELICQDFLQVTKDYQQWVERYKIPYRQGDVTL